VAVWAPADLVPAVWAPADLAPSVRNYYINSFIFGLKHLVMPSRYTHTVQLYDNTLLSARGEDILQKIERRL